MSHGLRFCLLAALLVVPGCRGSSQSDSGTDVGSYADSGDAGGGVDIVYTGECLYDEDCPEGHLCLESEDVYPTAGSNRRSCQPHDQTLDGRSLVGRTGCAQDNLVDVDVWRFCDEVDPVVGDGDIIRGTICNKDRRPAFRFPVQGSDSAVIEFYLDRADESLSAFSVEIYDSRCVFKGWSGGIPLDQDPHHGPLELGFQAPSEYTLVFDSQPSRPLGYGSFTVKLTETRRY
jgi:hypothetical protein